MHWHIIVINIATEHLVQKLHFRQHKLFENDLTSASKSYSVT